MLWGEPGAPGFLRLGPFDRWGISAEGWTKSDKADRLWPVLPKTDRPTAERSTFVLMVGIAGIDFWTAEESSACCGVNLALQRFGGWRFFDRCRISAEGRRKKRRSGPMLLAFPKRDRAMAERSTFALMVGIAGIDFWTAEESSACCGVNLALQRLGGRRDTPSWFGRRVSLRTDGSVWVERLGSDGELGSESSAPPKRRGQLRSITGKQQGCYLPFWPFFNPLL